MKLTQALAVTTLAVIALTGCKTTATAKRGSEYDRSAVNVPSEAPSKPVDTPSPVPVPATPEPADSRPVILCFGDSLTAGYGTEPGESYPDYLQSYLSASGYNYRVVNQGISGDTTKDALARVQDAINTHPAVILVEIGGNDGLRGVPISSTRANFDGIFTALKSTNAKIILMGITLPPQYGKDYITQFDETYTLMAKKYDVALLPFLYKGVYGTKGSIQEDGIHATAQGNKQVAKNVLPLVTPLLKK